MLVNDSNLINHITKTFTIQQGQSDCGVACLSSIIKYHGGFNTLETLKMVSGTKSTGTSLLGLHQGATRFGFESQGLQATIVSDLESLENPAILHIVKDNMLHYIVFYGFLGKELVIGDPQIGIEKWKAEDLEKVWNSKSLLALNPTKDFKQTEIKDNYGWIRNWIKQDINILVGVLFLGIIISVFNLSSAVFIQKLIDDILPTRDWSKLMLGLSLFSFLLLMKAFAIYARGKFIVRQSNDFNIRMFDFFIEALVNLPKFFFDSRKTGELVARMNDTRKIQSTLSNLVTNLLLQILVMTISILAIFVYSYYLGLVVILFLPLFFLAHTKFHQPIVLSQKKAMGLYGLNESNYIDLITGISEVKSTAKFAVFHSISKRHYSSFQNQVFNLGMIQVRFGTVTEILISFLLISVLGAASYFYLQNIVELGVVFACFSLVGTIGPAAAGIVIFNMQIQEAKIAFERMNEYTSIESEQVSGSVPDFENVNKLALKEIDFNYPGSISLLSNVNLEINKGTLTAILGESGEGKSTLIQLIQRFYSPVHGQILLDDINIDTIHLDHYRKHIAVVSQDTKIFNNHLLFNITLTEDESEYQKAFLWCESLGFSKYFNRFPQGYNTIIGEGGINISGGQKQLVALARALYQKPHFLLIDEGTSAMDKNTESFVLRVLQDHKHSLGVLFVTHRIKTAASMERIFILKNGKIDQSGTPYDLLRTKNLFSDEMNELLLINS